MFEAARLRGWAATARHPSPVKPRLVYRAEARRRRAKDGGPDRDRTGDLMNAIHARSQLRYRPTLERVNPNVNPPGRQGQTSGTAQVLLEKAFPGVGPFASSGRPLLWQSTEK